jgi:hypothetical protein
VQVILAYPFLSTYPLSYIKVRKKESYKNEDFFSDGVIKMYFVRYLGIGAWTQFLDWTSCKKTTNNFEHAKTDFEHG